jgi:hypothetical protein
LNFAFGWLEREKTKAWIGLWHQGDTIVIREEFGGRGLKGKLDFTYLKIYQNT